MRRAVFRTGAGAALLAVWLAAPAGAAAAEAPFAAYLDSALPPADGFDFPVGDAGSGRVHRGWRVSLGFGRPFALGIHPGEDFTGRGGGASVAGQPVRAVAAGRVIYAGRDEQLWGGVVMIQHVFYENQRKRRIRSLYAHLGAPAVAAGDAVRRRQVIGRIGRHPTGLYAPHLHLELRWDESLPAVYWPAAFGEGRDWIARHYAPPSRFIRAHRRLFVPPREPRLVLVDAAAYRMRCYRDGRPVGDYAVSLGQGHGAKRRRGDLNTPRGMYFVTEKKKGEFGGRYGGYFGGHWIEINYPNRYDAERGRSAGLIGKTVAARIRRAWARRRPTPAGTRLGSGIGLHGWIEEWDDAGPRHLSWGCVVLHLRDIGRFYDQVEPGTMVVIF